MLLSNDYEYPAIHIAPYYAESTTKLSVPLRFQKTMTGILASLYPCSLNN